ncbi:MAG: prepilin-type N-terminal cleavage/methylation domain-containing protein [Armatimonadota bacterium]
MRRGRHGLTLVELLVAMSIMLVGIYAVASGFPALFGTLEGDRIRSEMAGRVEARMERLKTNPMQVPDAVAGYDPGDGSVFSPTVQPDESETPVPANPRDDLTWVFGEKFQVPLTTGDYAVYPLSTGLADADTALLEVNRLHALERVDAGLPMDTVDDFRITAEGLVDAPDDFDRVRVDYVWVDVNGIPHGVTGEVVDNGATVAAAEMATPEFANVLPELSEATGLVSYTVMVGQHDDVNWLTSPRTAVLESNFGATLMVPAADAGELMEFSYILKTDAEYFENEAGDPETWHRRAPIMMEEIIAPNEGPFTVELAFRGIDDENALFTESLTGDPLTDMDGVEIADPVYVLVVDMDNGYTWTGAEEWISLDFIEGRLTLDWSHTEAPYTAAQARGLDLRVYYRTIGGHTIVVEKAPTSYVNWQVAEAAYSEGANWSSYANPDLVDYRTYELAADPTDDTYGQLIFPASAEGQMVTVDYVLLDQDGVVTRRVNGELHTIGLMETAATIAAGEEPVPAVTLDRPAPVDGTVGILSVRGVSTAVRGWWHDGRGRVQTVGIDTFLAPEPLS